MKTLTPETTEEMTATEEVKSYKWRLTWSSCKPTPSLLAAVAELSKFHIWKGAGCHFVNYDEYTDLVAKELIDPPQSYWKVAVDEIGLVSYASDRGYTKTWEELSNCRRDFQAGWDACEKGYKMLRDWDLAIEYNKVRYDYTKSIKRTFKMTPRHDDHNTLEHEVERFPLILNVSRRWLRNQENPVYTINTKKCTGEELESLVQDMMQRYWRAEFDVQVDDIRRQERNWKHHSFFTVFKEPINTLPTPSVNFHDRTDLAKDIKKHYLGKQNSNIGTGMIRFKDGHITEVYDHFRRDLVVVHYSTLCNVFIEPDGIIQIDKHDPNIKFTPAALEEIKNYCDSVRLEHAEFWQHQLNFMAFWKVQGKSLLGKTPEQAIAILTSAGF
jgi:hypothetical protein